MSHFGGGREDCWSEGATASLVEAWGDRYLQLNRGNLRQKDWSDVANAVDDRQETVGKPRKTDVQCKNRIDTLKKKYKSEKSKPGDSQWPFFYRLDHLVGPGSAPAVKKRLSPLTVTVKTRNPNLSRNLGGSSSRPRVQTPVSSESSGGDNDEDEDDEMVIGGFGSVKRKWEGLVGCDGERGGGGGGAGEFGELARAIIKFAKVYERVESTKQQQLIELERQRMEFVKDLEFQRMKMLMEAQLEIEKIKRPKYGSGSGKKI